MVKKSENIREFYGLLNNAYPYSNCNPDKAGIVYVDDIRKQIYDKKKVPLLHRERAKNFFDQLSDEEKAEIGAVTIVGKVIRNGTGEESLGYDYFFKMALQINKNGGLYHYIVSDGYQTVLWLRLGAEYFQINFRSVI